MVDARPRRFRILVVLATGIAAVGALLWWTHSRRDSPRLATARRAYQSRDFETAESLAGEILKQFPDSTEALSLRAESAAQLEHWDIAAQSYRGVAAGERNPVIAAAAWMNAGRSHMNLMQARAAEECLRKAVELDPDRHEPHRLLAQLYSVEGRTLDVERELLRLIQLDAHTMDDLILLDRPASYIDDPERRNGLLAEDPQYKVPLLAAARAAIHENRTEDAERILREILFHHPDLIEAHALLGEILVESSPGAMTEWLEGLPPAAAHDSLVWRVEGTWLRRLGRSRDAVRCFWEAFDIRPEDRTAANQLALSLAEVGEPGQGRIFLEHLAGSRTISNLTAQIDLEQAFDRAESLIDELQRHGRLWEAWAWCRLVEKTSPQPWAAERARELHAELSIETPRSIRAAVPGSDFDWRQFPLPEWRDVPPPSGFPVVNDSGREGNAPRFTFLAERAEIGLDFTYRPAHDPSTPGKRMIELTGGGIAALDYDSDSWPDLYFVQGGDWPIARAQSPPIDALFRNHSGLRFQTAESHARIHESLYGQGVAAGDFDSDGFPDLYIANIGRNRLLRNNGDGTFEDATESAGSPSELWTMSCLIADLNGDLDPDLYDVNYLQSGDAYNVICTDRDGVARACRPDIFPAAPDAYFQSDARGHFTSPPHPTGLEHLEGRGMGILAADLDGSGQLTLFVTNDMSANYLLDVHRPERGQSIRFIDRGLLTGVAFDRDGLTQASMGIASADLNSDGILEFFVTNFAEESNTLYLSQSGGGYQDATRAQGLREPSFAMLGFGTEFLDADLNGRHDLLIINGHIDDFSHEGQPYRMPPQFLEGAADRRFREVDSEELGDYFTSEHIGRGLAVLDWNHDGAPDAAVSHIDESVALLSNQTEPRGHFLQLELVGVNSPRVPFGTRVRVRCTQSEQVLQLTGGNGYSVSHERLLTAGLGAADQVDELEIHWISGRISRFRDLPVNRRWIAVEDRGQLLPAEIRPTVKTPPAQ